jgi:hypothetical protein
VPATFLIEILIVAAAVAGVVILIRSRASRSGPTRGSAQDLRCPSETCGYLNDRRARFCANCGRPLKPVASDKNAEE